MNTTPAKIFARTDHEDVATIEFNNPPTSLVTRVFIAELMALVDALSKDNAKRRVVFQSAKADFFVIRVDMTLAELRM